MTNPITFMVDGRQYISVITGYRNFTANQPAWDYREQKRRVLTFALDGKAMLSPAAAIELPVIDDPGFEINPQKVELGRTTFRDHCFVCHGYDVVAGGAAPDLRKSSIPLSFEAITAVVRNGALRSSGMPQFEEFTPTEIEGLQHYIRQRARESLADNQ